MPHRALFLPKGLLFSIWLACLLSPGCAPRVKTAAWVIRYDIDTPAEAQRVCAAAKAANLDELLVQVRGRADAFYQSAVAPRAETLQEAPDGFDPLAAVLAACQPIPVQAWINIYYLWGGDAPPENPDHPARPERGWILRDANGKSVNDYSNLDRSLGWIEGVYADPASEKYRRLMGAVVRELLANYPIKGIHLDFIRYPGLSYGQTGPLGDLFQQSWGIDPRFLPLHLDSAVLANWLSGSLAPADRVLVTAALFWAELRASRVTAMVRDIRMAMAQDGRQDTRLSAAVSPDAGDAFLAKGQDWRTWVAEGLVDAVYPMTYFGDTARVEAQLANNATSRTPDSLVRLWAGLGAYIKEPDRIAEEAGFARNNGYDGIALFSLGHLLRKAEGVRPYAEAIAGAAPALASRPAVSGLSRVAEVSPAAAQSPPPGVDTLKRILFKSLGGRAPALSKDALEKILAARLAELGKARTIYFKQAATNLGRCPATTPSWVELRGIFRYAHPLDTREKWRQQWEECEKARQRVVAGEDFAAIAREVSQGGGRDFGGLLGRRFLDPDEADDQILALLRPGEISPVMEVQNGFWLYRLEAGGQSKKIPPDQISWPARRILFRQALNKVIAGQDAQQPSGAK